LKVGIVGSEGAKFTSYTEARAKKIIRRLLDKPEVTHVVSGGCHLGGIDIWAVEIGRELGKKIIEHRPKTLSWSTGYAPRNLLIAKDSDEIFCITVAALPDTYTGMVFNLCYHCGTDAHVKSGGCWTVKKAIEMGKPGKIIVIH
jgi:hypothetical protein